MMLVRKRNAASSIISRACGVPNGVPGGIRTHGLPLRRRSLYPTELRKHLAPADILHRAATEMSISRLSTVFNTFGMVFQKE